MEEDYVMIPGSGTKKIIRDVKRRSRPHFWTTPCRSLWTVLCPMYGTD